MGRRPKCLTNVGAGEADSGRQCRRCMWLSEGRRKEPKAGRCSGMM